MKTVNAKIEEIVCLANLGNASLVHQIKFKNDVFRIECGADAYYLKTYTKDWYGDHWADTGYQVKHEATAWAILAANKIPVPEVVHFSESCDNPLDRPFLMTRQLSGKPLTELLEGGEQNQLETLLREVGTYIRRMHHITFSHPGYLDTMSGPSVPLTSSDWQHRCWSADQRQRDALATLEADKASLSEKTTHQIREMLSEISKKLVPAYQPPRYTHGDCHAHQFYLAQRPTKWEVTGVLDMEVSSAGDSGEDILKLCIELAQRYPPETCWWEPLFEGYGTEPDFECFKYRLLGVAPVEFWLPNSWGSTGKREKVLTHFLRAKDWFSLFSPV